ncbi:type I-E CRISPR-associated protein Cas5/CasD [Embleya sp. NPDC008237]|uniref:type I-E CRISPR-associated protein Cas5/CasD n=1 Tax=Embleya sp. NPDC008237 TaxID=3363978 RepID=UPI0036E3C1B8
MSVGFLLHLAAPLQAWGERSQFPHQRDTSAEPTRSGLIGMIAAAQGRTRETPIDDLAALRFVVRVDRAGSRLRDLHTVGGGMPRRLTVATAEGKRRSGETTTVLGHRFYLQDAAFTVAITAPDEDLVHACAQALRTPHWPPYLGRRSCPPNAPMVLGDVGPDPVARLLELPLARRRPGRADDPDATVAVDVVSDHALPELGGTTTVASEIQDEPRSFDPLARRYGVRALHRTTVRLPAARCAGVGLAHLSAVIAYLNPEPADALADSAAPTAPRGPR